VIMSGGDPLMLSDRRLEVILTRLPRFQTHRLIGIGSRVPCHLPERITPSCAPCCGASIRFSSTPFNHPDRLTSAAAGLGMLADAGIPAGVPDGPARRRQRHPAVMVKLMQRLLMARVRPTIYMADGWPARSTSAPACKPGSDHEGAARLDQRARESALRDRRAGSGGSAAPAGVRGEPARTRSSSAISRRSLRLSSATSASASSYWTLNTWWCSERLRGKRSTLLCLSPLTSTRSLCLRRPDSRPVPGPSGARAVRPARQGLLELPFELGRTILQIAHRASLLHGHRDAIRNTMRLRASAATRSPGVTMPTRFSGSAAEIATSAPGPASAVWRAGSRPPPVARTARR
jgi:hypothetical protein